jgi:MFS family permease
MFGAGAVNVLDVFFVTENLDVDPSWLGTLSAAFGVGSIVGALVVGRATAWLGEVRLFTLGIVVTGLLVLAYSRTTSLPVAVVVLALVGIPLAMVNVVVGPLVLRTTPGDLLGRVNAVLNPLVYLSSLLSMAVTSFVASTVLHDLDVVVGGVRFGRIDTIFSVAGLLMVAAGLAAARPLSRGVPTPATPDPVDRQPVLEVPRT